MTRYTDIKLIRRILRLARPYWLHIASILLLGLLSAPLALLNPLPLKIVVDSVIGSKPLPDFLDWLTPVTIQESNISLIFLTASLVVFISLFSQFQKLGHWLLSVYTGEKLVLEFRRQLFNHVQRLSFIYHDSKGITESLYRVEWDAQGIKYLVIDSFIPLITASCTFLAMIYVISLINWLLAAIALAVSPILFLLARQGRNLRYEWKELYRLHSSALSIVQEVLAALRLVRAFGQEERESQRFMSQSQQAFKGQVRLTFLQGRLDLLIGMTTGIGTAITLFVGTQSVLLGNLTLGNLILVMAYLSQLYGPLQHLSSQAATIQSHLASLERAFLLLEEAPDVIERPDTLPLSRCQGSICFQNVSFAYNDKRQILHNISFEVVAGTRVGVAGKTGAVKTTILSLLNRFYDPIEGQILLDGVDLKDYKLADLRNQFSIVLQEPILFSTTIAENIAYGSPNADEQEIIDAAKMANVHDFIEKLPDDYQTQVGERGIQLSGGERQRISLARAFLKDAPILILDEPTSSVDMKTEAGIVEAMEHLMQGKTTFMIAHRLSTLESCDLMLVIESGRLVAIESDVKVAVRTALASGGLESLIDKHQFSI